MAKTKSENQAKYAKANTVTKTVQLNKETDKDIIELLANVNNFQGYIKDLIRQDKEGEKKYMKHRKTATRMKKEEFKEWFKGIEKFKLNFNMPEGWTYERDELYNKWLDEYLTTGNFHKGAVEEYIALFNKWRHVDPYEGITEDEYYKDADEGYKDGFNHPFDDELKTNNLY